MVEFEHREFNQFIEREKGRWSKDTWQTRQSGLVKFEEYILEEGIDFTDCNVRDIDSFLSHMRKSKENNGEGLTDLTSSLYLTAVRKFYNWYLMDMDKENPVDSISTEHMNLEDAEYDKITLNEEELNVLIDSATTKRGKALISLMASTGLRLREACTLELDQVQFGFRKIEDVYTLKRKEDVERDVFFGRKTRRILKDYINSTRSQHGESDYLFTSRGDDDGHMSVDRGRVEFRRAVDNCGELEKYLDENIMADGRGRSTITTHILRRSFCQIFVDNGGDLMSLKNITGWKNLETAKSYLDGSNDLSTRDKYGVNL